MNSYGWKSILRPIRDGFRHLFPAPDTGPTPEEREQQRQLDKLRGFTYLDSFEQLYAWTEEDSDSLQRANTPLLPRVPFPPEQNTGTANVLLCHDYAGNYHAYEASQGAGIRDELYACEYLQFVDTFVYFSHKLVCVPPPSWINSLHRNGVTVLGTLLIEPQTKDTERLLEHHGQDEEGRPCGFTVAKVLGTIADHYGFDGWLINIESQLPKETWSACALVTFLKELRSHLGQGKKVIWYDALTLANKVDHQNDLTRQNSVFAEACGGILTNYSWKEKDAEDSKLVGQEIQVSGDDVYLGVDVWAQNKASITHPRSTYGGGGTRTGIAVATAAGIGLAIGIFAPAWSFEHFPAYDRAVERVMWDGCGPPDSLECSCRDATQRHPPNRSHPITRFAREYPVGSARFFYTDFQRAFAGHAGELDCLYDGQRTHSQLGMQAVLPYIARSMVLDDPIEGGINVLSQRLEELPTRMQLGIELGSVLPFGPNLDPRYQRMLPIYKFRMVADGSLEFRVKYQYALPIPGASMRLYLRFDNSIRMFPFQEGMSTQVLRDLVISQPQDGEIAHGDMLQEMGVCFNAPPIAERARRLLEIVEIRICSAQTPNMSCTISNIRIHDRGTAEDPHIRLCWDFYARSKEQWLLAGFPYSQITGPFSYFCVEINGVPIGRAYCTEYSLHPSLVEKLSSLNGVRVVLTGVGFNGDHLTKETAVLRGSACG